jgi:DNA polymerase I-like protein with 3'-5' exonuclease and polymerase domains
MLKAPALKLTYAEHLAATERLFAAHPSIRTWQDIVKSNVLDPKSATYRKAIDPFGRVRILYGPSYDIVKQALNTPIQGGASYIINKAMIAIQRWLSTHDVRCKMVLQVHDQLIFDLPSVELPVVFPVVKVAMEAPVVIADVERVFPTDAEVGPSWGTLKSYKGA